MSRLVLLELTRLRWRRAVLLLLAACVLVPAVILGLHAWETRPVSDADLAQAQQQLDRDLADPGYQRQVERCEQRPERYGVEPDGCAEMMGPQLEWYLYREVLDVQERGHAPSPRRCSRIVGSRWETRPEGFQIMISTMTSPNEIIR